MTIRLLLVDDQALFREGLRILLSVHADLEVVGEAADGKEAVELTADLKPDVALMDLRMPVLDGVEATRLIRQEHAQTAVIVLTTFDDDEDVFEALRAGAAGYLLKDVSSEKLVEAIRAAAQGGSFLQPSVAAKVIAEFTRISSQPAKPEAQPLVEPLSEREMEILAIMATGATNREIAGQLYITEGTVKNHVTNILGKLDARDRTQAVVKAQQLGII
jgi:DNA-binding NarL/FixJ family response regulator